MVESVIESFRLALDSNNVEYECLPYGRYTILTKKGGGHSIILSCNNHPLPILNAQILFNGEKFDIDPGAAEELRQAFIERYHAQQQLEYLKTKL